MVERLTDNTVKVDLWYTSSDDRSLDFIRNIAEYLEPIIDQVIFEPKFVSWSCPNCDSDYKRINCMSEGKYCAMQHAEKLELAGQEILLEDLRQWCIFQQSRDRPIKEFMEPTKASKWIKEPSFYFEYIKITHEICRNRITTECA